MHIGKYENYDAIGQQSHPYLMMSTQDDGKREGRQEQEEANKNKRRDGSSMALLDPHGYPYKEMS